MQPVDLAAIDCITIKLSYDIKYSYLIEIIINMTVS